MIFLQNLRTLRRTPSAACPSDKSYASIVSGMLRRLKIAINERIYGEISRREGNRLIEAADQLAFLFRELDVIASD